MYLVILKRYYGVPYLWRYCLDLLFIFQLVEGVESDFMKHFGIILLFFVIALGLHALHYFGLIYIKKKVSDESFIEAIGKLEELRNSFYHKANQISKEIK